MATHWWGPDSSAYNCGGSQRSLYGRPDTSLVRVRAWEAYGGVQTDQIYGIKYGPQWGFGLVSKMCRFLKGEVPCVFWTCGRGHGKGSNNKLRETV